MSSEHRGRIFKLLLILATVFCLTLFSFKYLKYVHPEVTAVSTTDFPNYFFAGKRLLTGDLIYRPFNDELESLTGATGYRAYTADTPLTILLLSPLSELDIAYAAHTLNIISVLLLSLSIFVVSMHCGFSFLACFFFTALSLSSHAFLFLLKRCHMESVLLFLAIYGFIRLSKGTPGICGFLWGLAASLKLFPLMWLLPYFRTKSKRALFFSGILSFLFFSSISFFVVGGENFRVFVFEVIPKSAQWYGTAGNYSIISFFTALLGYDTAVMPSIFVCLLLLVYFLKLIFTHDISDKRAYAVSTSAALLLSPLSWLNYLILIFPALIFIAETYRKESLKNLWPFILLIIIFWNWPDYIDSHWRSLTVFLYFQRRL